MNKRIKFEHIAIWVKDLELTRNFYTKYLAMSCSDIYVNPKNHYSSYFLSFSGSETRLEIMHRPDIEKFVGNKGMTNGLAHISVSVGSKERVNEFTERIRQDGFQVVSEPRTTGDGYYESVVLDPEKNYIEITE